MQAELRAALGDIARQAAGAGAAQQSSTNHDADVGDGAPAPAGAGGAPAETAAPPTATAGEHESALVAAAVKEERERWQHEAAVARDDAAPRAAAGATQRPPPSKRRRRMNCAGRAPRTRKAPAVVPHRAARLVTAVPAQKQSMPASKRVRLARQARAPQRPRRLFDSLPATGHISAPCSCPSSRTSWRPRCQSVPNCWLNCGRLCGA